MQETAGFAAKQWQSIAERVTDPALKQRVTNSLRDMETAISQKSAVNAGAAVTSELDLVDMLGAYFNHTRG